MAVVTDPAVSVVVATFDRGPLIAATLESVARQSVDEFEVLVVSDGPAASGLASTVASFGERFRLLETDERCGSQWQPNTLGWSTAAAPMVAYLGHDDIWLPDHVAALLAAFERRPGASFAASGCIFSGPPGAGPGHAWVTGMFDPDDERMALTHFFPPSSVAHRRDLPTTVVWPDASAVRRPVDSQFMLDAASAGCRFTSTGRITVLKFNSTLRYLSYLGPDDDEQREALALIDDPPRLAAKIAALADDAAAHSRYMTTLHPSSEDQRPGETVRLHAAVRGIDTPPLQRLEGPTWVAMDDGPRGFDWYPLEGHGDVTWRWSGPNPRPRFLVPYTSDSPVRLSIHLGAVAADDVLDSLVVLVDRRRVAAEIRRPADVPVVVVEVVTTLRAGRPSVVELRMPRTVRVDEFVAGSADTRRVGVSMTGIHLDPIG